MTSVEFSCGCAGKDRIPFLREFRRMSSFTTADSLTNARPALKSRMWRELVDALIRPRFARRRLTQIPGGKGDPRGEIHRKGGEV